MRCLVATLLFAFTALAAARQGDVEVVIQARAAAQGPVVRISDVADLEPLRAINARAAARIANVPVGIVRAGVDRLELETKTVREIIRWAAARERVALVITHRSRVVSIQTELRALDGAAAEHEAAEALSVACQALARDCAVQGSERRGEPLRVPNGKITYEASLPPRWNETSSPARVAVRILVDGVSVGAVKVPIAWTASRQAFELSKPVQRGEAVRVEDVRAVRVSADEIRSVGVVYSVRTQLMHATQSLDVGTIIAPVAMHALAAFRTGEALVVEVGVGPVRVQREAIALQNGREGGAALVKFESDQLTTAKLPMQRAAVEGAHR